MDGVDGHEAVTWVGQLLETVWDGVALGTGTWNPDKSCYDLYEEYRKANHTPGLCAYNFIDWQTAKAGGAGFVLGLPGLAFGVVTIPADLAFTIYLQLRMVAVIALLYGWDLRSDRVKTIALLAMLGASAGQLLSQFGITVGGKLAANLLAKIPGKVLIEINKAVGFRLLTKAGSAGAVNLIKFVPIVGGVVGGSLNAITTRQIGFAADSFFKEGPNL